MNWSEYQDQAAEFFTRLGLDTKIEHELEGARGLHVVDVYASGSFNGIAFNWVVECKSWKTNIPKEKVMALSAIVQERFLRQLYKQWGQQGVKSLLDSC